MKKILAVLGALLFLSAGNAQNQSSQKPCTAAESSQFDFWVGDWDLTWNDTSHGTNKIYKIFDGCTLMGNFENGEMKLSTQPRKLQNGKEMISRMVFYNIQPNTFDWRWEASTDNGNTWKTNWLIHYKRKV